jgi:1-phosphofructokinase
MNPAIDVVVELDAFVPDAVNKAWRSRSFCGGKGLNVALVLSLLGVRASAAGLLGADHGERFRDFCAGRGIEFLFDAIPGETRTNIKLAVDGRPATDINLPGPAVTADAVGKVSGRLLALARPGDVFILSGSLPPGAPAGLYAELITGLRARNAEVCLDASGGALALGLRAGPNLAKPNREELLAVSTPMAGGADAVAAAAKVWIGAGAGALAVSLGADGALWASADETFRAAPGAVKAVNMIGAGDAFLAGLVYGGLRGWDSPRRLRFAVGLSAHWVEKMERMTLDRERVDKLADSIELFEAT